MRIDVALGGLAGRLDFCEGHQKPGRAGDGSERFGNRHDWSTRADPDSLAKSAGQAVEEFGKVASGLPGAAYETFYDSTQRVVMVRIVKKA